MDALPPLIMRRDGFEGVPRFQLEFGYLVRTYRPGDDRFWHAIVGSDLGGTWTAERFRREIIEAPQFDPEGLIFVTIGSRPAGTVCAWREDPAEGAVGTLRMMTVKPEHRGKAIGRFLTMKALDYFRVSGFRSVELAVGDECFAAIRTYLALGFAAVMTHESHARRWESILRQIERSARRE